MDLSDLHGNSETTIEDEQKLSEKVNKKSQELLVHLNERDELVNSIQLKNRFIALVHRVEEVSKATRDGKINSIRSVLSSLRVPVPTALAPHSATLCVPYIPECGYPSDEQLEALCRCLEAMATNSRSAPNLLAKYICSVYLS
jgi:hypothetical protein